MATAAQSGHWQRIKALHAEKRAAWAAGQNERAKRLVERIRALKGDRQLELQGKLGPKRRLKREKRDIAADAGRRRSNLLLFGAVAAAVFFMRKKKRRKGSKSGRKK